MYKFYTLLIAMSILFAQSALSAQETNTDTTAVTEADTNPVSEVKSQLSTEQQLLDRINLNPKDKTAYESLSRFYFNTGNHSARIKIISKAIQNLGDNAEYYKIIGDEYKILQEHLKSIIAYQKAIQIQPRNHMFYNRLGLVQLKLQHYHQAETSFKAAVYYGKNISRKAKGIYINNLGVAYEARREFKDAAKYFKLCLSYYPTYKNAIDNLERVSEELKKQGNE